MKTFKEFLAEAQHYIDHYGKWGIITKDKGVIYGMSHKTATSHDELAKAHGHKLYSGSYAEFYQHPGYGDGPDEGDHLALRTYGKDSAALAHKHFDGLPHMRRGGVVHEHLTASKDGNSFSLDGPGKSGKRYEIKHHLAVVGGL